MRHNAKRTSRGRPQQKKQGNTNSRVRVYESSGPDVKIRGTAYQVTEKYEALAKDAETSGNIVLAENYRQHAEHYQRIISAFADETPIHADKMQNDRADNTADDNNDDSSSTANVNAGQNASQMAMA